MRKRIKWPISCLLLVLLLTFGYCLTVSSETFVFGFLDRTVLMLDRHRYKFAYLKIEGKLGTWKPVFESDNPDIATVSKKGKIIAKHAGTAVITLYARVPGKEEELEKLDDCHVRVITNAWEKLPGDTKTTGINYVTEKKPLWTNRRDNIYLRAEVESYINNSQDLIARDPDRWPEGKAFKVYGWETKDPTKEELKETKKYYKRTVFRKKKGEISANGWLIFFSSKAQYLWILQLQENGSWKVVDQGPVSGGYDCGCFNNKRHKKGARYFNSYLCTKNGGSKSPWVPSWYGWVGWDQKKAPTNWSNAFHESMEGVREGIPASEGCIHTGNSHGHLHKTLDRAGVGTRIIRY